ncbi:11068_t:CDS:2 [Ambispora gerdemannii]|uniref:11068_t:CDS:1 n=1 Tax=Ambispora gerdemannii TaxID=144530 RepID=A0A9N9GHR9_9GLOM|nr:11068_t:CDS:2 [Ambispora gerdemannii]
MTLYPHPVIFVTIVEDVNMTSPKRFDGEVILVDDVALFSFAEGDLRVYKARNCWHVNKQRLQTTELAVCIEGGAKERLQQENLKY